ncbi:MAG: tetratricopeptide repeat protein [Fimbriimonadaceae bacterium]|nr:MAG: tetratricopeptide repeat protein [Fimbriimonadaceae bacterium]
MQEDPSLVNGYESLILDSYVAQALDDIGQVEPLVWSMADPVFRKIAAEKEFPTSWETPNQRDIVSVARQVGAEYTLVVWSYRNGAIVRPIATLYRGAASRKIWNYGDWDRRLVPFFSGDIRQLSDQSVQETNDQYKGVQREFSAIQVGRDYDWDSTSRTIAQTWAWLLRQDPFKSLPVRPKNDLPPPDPGLTVVKPPGVNLDPSGDGMKYVDDLLGIGNRELAIVYLRDLIDQHPFEEIYRTKLVDVLMDSRLYNEAALEADRAAPMAQNPVTFYLQATECWLRCGNDDKARISLNEVLARGGQGRTTYALLGRVYLSSGDYAQAAEAFSQAIQLGPTPEMVYFRAASHALAGDPDSCRQDLASLVDVDASGIADAYMEVMAIMEKLFEQTGTRTRDLIPQLRLKVTPDLTAIAARNLLFAQSMGTLIEIGPVPPIFSRSHQLRQLAHKLMIQSTTEVFEFAKTGKAETANEGTMSLGEALRMLPKIREQYRSEQSGQAAAQSPVGETKWLNSCKWLVSWQSSSLPL